MTTLKFDIVSFEDHHQAGVDLLMATIAAEYPEPFSSPQSKSIKELSLLPTGKYWVACVNTTVVGTVGFVKTKDNAIVLKRMFLKKEFRGQGIANALLETVTNFAVENKYSGIFLGTMIQFKAAQKFYVKNGFKEIAEATLPHDFPANPVDKVFFKKELK